MEEVFGIGGTLGRETSGEVVLVSRLRAALERLNPALPPEALGVTRAGEPSLQVRARVVAARERQARRYVAEAVRANAELTPAQMQRFCAMDRPAARILTSAASRLALSARAYDRVRKVARTIADLDRADTIGADHVAEALQFRMIS